MKTLTGIIDVWDAQTFDADLSAELHANADLVRKYIVTERQIFHERETLRLHGTYKSNPHAQSYNRFLEDLERKMGTRTIRAWHYTRLTDREVEALLTTGIFPSTLDTIRSRLDAQVAAAELSAENADALFSASPFHDREQKKARSNKFCMVSHPHEITDNGVTLLLNNWGGEGLYFWLNDAHLEEAVARIGKPRVLEVAVPLEATRQAYYAGKSVLATFARTLGCPPDFDAFDLYTERALASNCVLAVHTEGDATFRHVGNGYPIGFKS